MKRLFKLALALAAAVLALFTALPARAEVLEKTGRVNPAMNEFVFALDGHEDEYGVWRTKAITVKDGGKKIQTLAISGFNGGEDARTFNKDMFLIEDMNFDGFADIRLQAFIPAGPNVPYICWLWDESARQFVHNADLSALTSVEVDAENQWLSSYVRENAARYTRSFYKYTDDRPVIFKVVEEIYSKEGQPPAVSTRYFSPDGVSFVREVGNWYGTDVTFEVYNADGEKIEDIFGVRGQLAWIDSVRFVVTRIDGLREAAKESDAAPAFAFRFSVVLFDTASQELIVLKEATDTRNFQFRGKIIEDESAVMVTEQSVPDLKDWSKEKEGQKREIRVDIPAAG